MREQPGRLTERLGYVPVLKIGRSEAGRIIRLDPNVTTVIELIATMVL